MKVKKQFIFAVVIIAAGISVVNAIKNRDTSIDKKNDKKAPVMTVDAIAVESKPFQIQIESFGKLEPAMSTKLTAQVSGEVIYISPQLTNGGSFNKGDILLKIDAQVYQSRVLSAKSQVAQAKLKLAEEKALAHQAEKDWQRIGKGKTATDLTLRLPHLEVAQANLEAAKAQLAEAKLNLEHTKIKAPYQGRVKSRAIGLGQVVQSTAPLADIYATNNIEIKLPIIAAHQAFIQWPKDDGTNGSPVKLSYKQGSVTHTLTAQLVRFEGTLDPQSQQLYAIAKLDPTSVPNNLPLAMGQFVSASIAGKTIEQAITIPSSSIYQGQFVYVVADNLLNRQEINIIFQNSKHSVVEGLPAQTMLVTTPLGQIVSGTQVSIKDANSSKE